jgi:hypothetical protein
MSKYQTVMHETIRRPVRTRAPLILAIGLLVLLSPLLYEGGLVMTSRWQSMMGTYWVPKTPVLDAITDWSRDAKAESQFQYSRLWGSGTWKPSTTVPIAITWAVLMACVFLRKVR